MKRISKLLIGAVMSLTAVVGVSAPADAGLYGCKWWVTQTTGSPYYSPVTIKATCQGATPGGFRLFRLRGKCSNGVWITDSWRGWTQSSGIWGYTCQNLGAPTRTLSSISIDYRT